MEKHQALKGDKKKLVRHLEIIKRINLDFVTFGTPVRYTWGNHQQSRILSIINHRSNVHISGLLNTRDGDYLQHWGVEGTDMIPPLGLIKPNDELDTVLDKGRDVSLVITNLEIEERRQPKFTNGDAINGTLLVNYKDNAPFSIYFLNPFSIPHCIKTLFGHAIYTRKQTMLFNMNLIVKHFYS